MCLLDMGWVKCGRTGVFERTEYLIFSRRMMVLTRVKGRRLPRDGARVLKAQPQQQLTDFEAPEFWLLENLESRMGKRNAATVGEGAVIGFPADRTDPR
ncbi:hypothetical protein BD293_0089 [Roseinatronobacter monicus]|uniref:Uncharacterized protein n=1 Tax=Roseinatronobacter monicus TaxID=393481 RepID=A0A543K904_9RHOB|nr:hypothetical protein BD293_0089 [Roseinatronobacter monicus]